MCPAASAPRPPVAKYRVTYTMDYLGEPHEVSGALFVPVDGAGDAVECALPTTPTCGTIFRRVDAPSYMASKAVGFLMATSDRAHAGLPRIWGRAKTSSTPIVCRIEAESGIAMLEAVAPRDDLNS